MCHETIPAHTHYVSRTEGEYSSIVVSRQNKHLYEGYEGFGTQELGQTLHVHVHGRPVTDAFDTCILEWCILLYGRHCLCIINPLHHTIYITQEILPKQERLNYSRHKYTKRNTTHLTHASNAHNYTRKLIHTVSLTVLSRQAHDLKGKRIHSFL